MAEMTDKEVEERLDKYRSGKKSRRALTIGGIIAAVVIVGGIAYHGHCVRAEEQRRIAEEQRIVEELKAKPLREWTAQEQEKYGELYQMRLKNEPIDFRGIFKTGVYSPIGNTTVKGVWIKKAIILFAFLTVLSWLLIALRIHIPLLWHLAYLCSSILMLFLLYILVLHFWRMLVQ